MTCVNFDIINHEVVKHKLEPDQDKKTTGFKIQTKKSAATDALQLNIQRTINQSNEQSNMKIITERDDL